MRMQGQRANGATVALDGIHHLAGRDLTFEIKLVEIILDGSVACRLPRGFRHGDAGGFPLPQDTTFSTPTD